MKLTLKKTALFAAAPAAIIAITALATNGDSAPAKAARSAGSTAESSHQVYHRTVEIEGQTVFYREAGPKDA
ncbi:MAG: hypothetical protein ACKVHP_24340, partial [Verrucomicrobiales bacterium]